MKKKILCITLCAALLAVAVVGGTLAYFTDTDSANNTFTAGNVDISLVETETDEYGAAVTPAATTQANEYLLVPAHTYIKDPTVTVAKDSEECYVRMKVEVTHIEDLKSAINSTDHPEYYGTDGVFLLQKLVGGWDSNTWVYNNYTTSGTSGIYEFRYNGTVAKATTDTTLDALFDTFTVPSFLTNEEIGTLANVDINVTADAIQADGFNNDADKAWAAFDAQ